MIYHSTIDTMTTAIEIDAIDHFITQKPPEIFAIVVVDTDHIRLRILFATNGSKASITMSVVTVSVVV